MPTANPDHTPVRSIRMDADRWKRLGEVYGDKKRSAVINDVIAWLLREQGAKLPQRPASGGSSE